LSDAVDPARRAKQIEAIETLTHVLRPAGGGVYVVSTGLSEQRALQRAIYRVEDDDAVLPAWRSLLAQADKASLWLLGVPVDTGAGFTRGSNLAPAELRRHLISHELGHPLLGERCLDVGDVRVIPQLLSEEMVSPEQLARSREALYAELSDERASQLPVTPLDQCRLTLDLLASLDPERDLHNAGVPIVLGGDHSVGWPAFAAAFERWERQRGVKLGLLHFDAHTDLLSERLGVKYCFATWAWHANQLLGEDGRLAQVGIRVSGRTREHWEERCNVRQFWATEVRTRGARAVAEEIIKRFEERGVEALYVSNDIDGTDPLFAAATGTPEPGGLTPDEVDEVTRVVGERFPLIGADLVEVAPPLSREEGEPQVTLETSARYLRTLAELALSPPNPL